MSALLGANGAETIVNATTYDVKEANAASRKLLEPLARPAKGKVAAGSESIHGNALVGLKETGKLKEPIHMRKRERKRRRGRLIRDD